ncbi:MAG: peptidase M61 [Sphingomicrobium sp.]
MRAPPDAGGVKPSAVLGLLALTIVALPSPAPAQNSLAQPLPPAPAIAAPRDIAYPGTIRLEVDARSPGQGVFAVRERIPVAPGPLTLLYPRWLPGNHGPSGEVDKLAGLVFRGGGRILPWVRDSVDLFAFHLDVPAGVREISADFQFLSRVGDAPGMVVMTPAMLNLQWTSLLLYPAGFYVRQIPVSASVRYPAGWTAATALRGTVSGGAVDYSTVPLDTLIDSPAFAGKHSRIVALRPAVTLNIFADRQKDLDAATPPMIDAHRRLVDQADRLFGARHYDHYDFLLALSERQSTIGLEHHRSSQNGVGAAFFREWDKQSDPRTLLPHEYTHSWNGKFRRPADLWTPDYRTPMRDSLLWVYEGQTEYWGAVLAARSGLVSREEALGELASIAAGYTVGRPGRSWRPLQDTANQPAFARHKKLDWASWQRGIDYYSEGQLLWTAVDQVIRERSRGRRSLDDFARRFFGMRPGDFGELTYDFDDVVTALETIQPYDWRGYLRTWLDATDGAHLLDGLTRGGYRLVWRDEPNIFDKNGAAEAKLADFTYSLGLTIGEEGKIASVLWDGPAFRAGIAPGQTLVAVDGSAYDGDRLTDAVRAAKTAAAPLSLLVKDGDSYRTVPVDYHGGLRYPALEKVAPGRAGIDRMFEPLR